MLHLTQTFTNPRVCKQRKNPSEDFIFKKGINEKKEGLGL